MRAGAPGSTCLSPPFTEKSRTSAGRSRLDYPVVDDVGLDIKGLGVEIGQNPVLQYTLRPGMHVLDECLAAPGEKNFRLVSEDQKLARPGTITPGDDVLNEVRRIVVVNPSGDRPDQA